MTLIWQAQSQVSTDAVGKLTEANMFSRHLWWHAGFFFFFLSGGYGSALCVCLCVGGEAFQLTAAAAKDAEGDTVGYQWSASLVKGQFDDKADRAQMPLRKLEKKDPPTTSEGCVCGLMERQREGFSLHLFPYLSMLVQSTKAKPHAAAMTTGRW